MTRPKITVTTLVLAALCVSPLVNAQEIKKQPKLPTADLGIPTEIVDDRGILLQDFGPTIAASSLIGRELIDRFHQPVGKVTDLIIDPRTAEFPLVIVEAILRPATPGPKIAPPETGQVATKHKTKANGKKAHNRQRQLLFPAAAISLQADQQGKLKLVGDRSDAVMFKESGSPQPLTRDWLVQRYLEREELESWKMAVHIPPRDDVTVPPKRMGNYRLRRFTELKGSTINGADDKPLGQIDDLAITIEHRRVPYAAITLSEDTSGQLYEAPLLVFVVEGSQPWKIELPEKLVKNSPKIDPQHWPTKISRGWYEYVNERYNNNPRDGVEVRGPDDLTVVTPNSIAATSPAEKDSDDNKANEKQSVAKKSVATKP